MSFLTDQESGALRLARMSLHIVGGDDDFEPQPELSVEHDDFLLQILRDIASDAVYRFAEISTTRSTVEAIATRKIGFQDGAQALAADFRRLHRSGVKDGAFFVFELGVADADVKIYALVKYDYSQALEIVHKQGATGLRRIVEAFVSNKSAIQKSAMIRIRRGSAEPALSTRDRMGRPAPVLTDFFRDYLQVTRDRNDEELTSDVKEVVRNALSDHKEFLPKGGMATCVSRANGVLRVAPEINEEVIRQAVWVGAGQPTDEETKARFNNSVDRLVRKKKLVGLAFAPASSVLPKAVRRTIMTEEGVRLEYNTALEGQSVVEEKLDDGRTRFVVTTQGYTDDVNSDRTRRPA
ncbi:hypothetical protein NKH34_28420 [Mesorhizobium sp. M1148]|uniref:hypothetical protein n=1 Tax=unclassified Mesorhizobium TaxID=325217 RepID=UPI0003D06218|nr:MULTISPECIES: hypothetical protein [unclassified Mesorhizobium]ESZ12383.1 hypothetical protein X735_22925 [Mesorhizobium sp. L2C085B000]ESZ24308.1 hypothetical protein X733_32265 [Mesorhizobium sp. L2C067A000]